MRHVLFVYDFIYDKSNYRWPKYSSDKTVELSFAKEQPVIGGSTTTLTDHMSE
jgi:hypothetical protein